MDVVFEPQMWLRALAGGSKIGLAASALLLSTAVSPASARFVAEWCWIVGPAIAVGVHCSY